MELPFPILHLMPWLTITCEVWILCKTKLGLCSRGASEKIPTLLKKL